MKKLIISITFMLLAYQKNADATLTGRTQTAQLTVTATVTTSCTVSATPVTFTTFESGTATNMQASSGKVTVKCPVGTIYFVGLDKGLYSGGANPGTGTTRTRNMINSTVTAASYQASASSVNNSTSPAGTGIPASTFLAYSLCQDTYGGKNWGNNTASYNADDGVVARIATATTASSGGEALPIYAQIASTATEVIAGTYTDTINVTLYY